MVPNAMVMVTISTMMWLMLNAILGMRMVMDTKSHTIATTRTATGGTMETETSMVPTAMTIVVTMK